jgi:hypothetical protein
MNYQGAPRGNHGKYERAPRWRVVPALFGVMCFGVSSWAVDPTSLEPVEPFEPHLLTIQEETQYDHFHHYELVTETNLLCDFTRNLGGELTVPTELDEKEPKGIGDVRLRLKYVFNPDQETGPMVALSGEIALPTAKESAGLGGDVDLRITMPLGESDAHHKLHLTLKETYFSGADTSSWRRWDFDEGGFRSYSGDREFAYQVVFGYSRLFGPATEFRADIDREQLDVKGHNANVIQAGISHDFGDSTTVMLGGGVGLGGDSPDFRIRTGIEFRWGGPSK